MFDDDADPSWFTNLFVAPDVRQDRRLRRLTADSEDTALTAETNARATRSLQARTDRLELICETLVELLLTRGLVTREELGVLFAQVDLRDGVEDGGLHTERPRIRAPLCSACERPVNPKRSACVYCGAKLEKGAAPPKRAARLVTCGACRQEVDQRESNFTASGLRCDRCYRGEA